ncbi:hypothetical protein SOPP22_15865 [Shewanella sp. OPT22]|nr:hypothetical protein SOPP22_15865 [Shewanella sp. OPT22]
MDDLNKTVSDNRQVISKKSWVAYVKPLVILFIVFLFLIGFHFLLGIIPILLSILVILHIRSVELYVDNDGVWIYSGIFPWNKGSSGVKWRDLDEAVYYTGFFSWLVKSYTVKISHRFTKDSEIVLSNMKSGEKAVPLINEYHKVSINKIAEA